MAAFAKFPPGSSCMLGVFSPHHVRPIKQVMSGTVLSLSRMQTLIREQIGLWRRLWSINNSSYTMKSDTVSKGRRITIWQGLLNILRWCKSFNADSIMKHTSLYFALVGKILSSLPEINARTAHDCRGFGLIDELCGDICKYTVKDEIQSTLFISDN